MLSPKKYSRRITVFVIVAFFFLLVAQALPLAAHDGLKSPQIAAGTQTSAPGFMEKVGNSEAKMERKSRLLPTLLGLAVAGTVVTVLVLTVFKKNGYNPHIIPEEFVREVGNSYFPLTAGRCLNYAVTAGEYTATLMVTSTVQTKLVMGVLCLGVQDREISSQKSAEDTWRWYAQDQDGNVWYFARETKKYDNGVMTEDWSWQAGINGAKPGKVMIGRPRDFLNKEYREEYVAGVAEDKAQIIGLNETVTVPYGTFSGCLKIKVYSDLQPGRTEYRYYASGIGLVLIEPGQENGRRVELVTIFDQLIVTRARQPAGLVSNTISTLRRR